MQTLAYSSIMWSTCPCMCLWPGSGRHAQGHLAPATLSSALGFEIRRRRADTQRSVCAGKGVHLCLRTMSGDIEQGQGLHKKIRKETLFFQ